MNDDIKKYPEGHFLGLWMGIGIAIFSVFGISISIATNNFGFIGVGPALGVAFGLSIGQLVENRYKQKGIIKPLNELEQKRKKNAIIAGIAILSLGVLLALILYLV